MIRLPPRSTRTDTLFPYTTLFRSVCVLGHPTVAGSVKESLRPCVVRIRSRNFWTTSSRSEEHTYELQSLMRISYAVFCLKKKTIKTTQASWDNTKITDHNVQARS